VLVTAVLVGELLDDEELVVLLCSVEEAAESLALLDAEVIGDALSVLE
jgi:hypothetical protein